MFLRGLAISSGNGMMGPMTQSLIYEVSVTYPVLAKEADFKRWLERHVAEVVGAGGFLKAQIFEVVSAVESRQWVVHYFAQSQEQLDRYLNQFSPAIREQAVSMWPEIQANRRILRS